MSTRMSRTASAKQTSTSTAITPAIPATAAMMLSETWQPQDMTTGVSEAVVLVTAVLSTLTAPASLVGVTVGMAVTVMLSCVGGFKLKPVVELSVGRLLPPACVMKQ